MTKAYASKWDLSMAQLKVEHESYFFTQSVSGDLATSEKEDLDMQRAQHCNSLMNIEM